MALQLTRPDGTPITDWRGWSPPKELKQWRAGRSAVELARAWFTTSTPACPPEVTALLSSSPLLDGLQLSKGIPECVTALPEAGEGRNHDLVLEGDCTRGHVVVAIEAKADEKFGPRIGKYWLKMRADREAEGGRPSRAPERIEKLLAILVGPAVRPDQTPWDSVRYQLLTAAVGTLIEAASRQAALAVLVIQEFRTTETDPENLARNSEDLESFLSALGLLSSPGLEPGRLYGPLAAAGNAIPLLIGKAVFDWSAA